MSELKKIADVYKKLTFIMSSTQKKYAFLVLGMGVVAALLELLGVAVIIPIMDMLLDMQTLRNSRVMAPFVNLFHLNEDRRLVWFVCIVTVFVYLLKNGYYYLYNWVSLKFSYKVKRELSIRVLRAYMRQGYMFFVENNTSRLLQGINGDVSSVYSILSSLFLMITKMLTIACIGVFILLQSKEMAIILVILALFCFALIQLMYYSSMKKNGELRRVYLFKEYQTSIEAIQGNKEILVMHKQDFFTELYRKVEEKLSRVCVKVDMGAVTPAYLIEMVCISGIMIAVAMLMGNTQDNVALVGQLSTVAVAAFRILPALGSITSGMNTITTNGSQLSAAYETLAGVKELERQDAKREIRASKYRNIQFQKQLEVKNVSYQYPNVKEMVLENVCLVVEKGQSVALIGPSGAGKTTVSDIILALLKPKSGQILMDGIDVEDLGEEWSKIVGYVPQSVYIVDDSIKNNIAFGEDRDSIDEGKVWEALKMAQLDEFVKGLPENIHTLVGERGIRFSGGQRQRLAIARALYREPDILILDEATAALDNATEEEVMKAIEALQGYKTLIIVAHRLTTIRNCNKIYEIRDGKAVEKSKAEVLEGIQ